MHRMLVVAIAAWTPDVIWAEGALADFDPKTHIEEQSRPPSTEPQVRSSVVTIGTGKYLKFEIEAGVAYLPYYGDIVKPDIIKTSCMKLHKGQKETETEEHVAAVEKEISARIKVYTGLIIKTIKDKCTGRAESYFLPNERGEVGVGYDNGGTQVKVYNRIETRPGGAAVNPRLGIGKNF